MILRIRSNPRVLLPLVTLLSACGGHPASVAPPTAAPAIAATPSAFNAASYANAIVFGGPRANYSISKSGTGFTVTDTVSSGGTVPVAADARLRFTDVSLALDTEGNAGKSYRVYRAAFNRTPDIAGLSFWIEAMDKGYSLPAIAAEFIKSTEFRTLYGAQPSNAQLVERLYRNVLQREGEPAGVAFWIDVLNQNKATRADVLAAFSESPENKAAVRATIELGIVTIESGVTYPAQGGGGMTYATLAPSASPDEARTQFNRQGALGYAFLSGTTSWVGNWAGELFVKGPAATYQYELLTTIENPARYLENLNALGARGYIFKAPMVYPYAGFSYCDLFVNSSAHAGSYSYRLVAEPLSLPRINANGADGYFFRGELFVGGGLHSMYIRDSAAGATYSYLRMPAKTFTTGLLAEMNQLGAQAYAFLGPHIDSAGTFSLYMKNSANPSPYSYSTGITPVASARQATDYYNVRSAEGNAYWGDLYDAGQDISIFYTGKPITHVMAGVVFP